MIVAVVSFVVVTEPLGSFDERSRRRGRRRRRRRLRTRVRREGRPRRGKRLRTRLGCGLARQVKEVERLAWSGDHGRPLPREAAGVSLHFLLRKHSVHPTRTMTETTGPLLGRGPVLRQARPSAYSEPRVPSGRLSQEHQMDLPKLDGFRERLLHFSRGHAIEVGG